MKSKTKKTDHNKLNEKEDIKIIEQIKGKITQQQFLYYVSEALTNEDKRELIDESIKKKDLIISEIRRSSRNKNRMICDQCSGIWYKSKNYNSKAKHDLSFKHIKATTLLIQSDGEQSDNEN